MRKLIYDCLYKFYHGFYLVFITENAKVNKQILPLFKVRNGVKEYGSKLKCDPK